MPAQKSQFVRELLRWYEKNQRKLPWRKTSDPYRIWVAETMLQQTRAATVERYYQRFLARFPTVQSLAQAPLDQVLKAWEGLGYYARARHLHQAAQIVVRQHGGALPPRKEKLLALPGIGRYSAGAILSIAFGKNEIVLDGNVRRVLARLLLLTDDPRLPQAENRLESALKNLLPAGRAGTFNQALMDLGATICLPKTPRCTLCPVAALCWARRLGAQRQLPVKKPRRALPHYEVAVGIIWKEGKLLIARRPPQGLLGGLWEFPGGKRKPHESLEECLHREVREELQTTIRVRRHVTSVKHSYSHFRVTLHAYECDWVSGKPTVLGCSDWAWIDLRELAHYAFPKANRKIIERLFSQGTPRSPEGRGTGKEER